MGEPITEQQFQQIREAVWNTLVTLDPNLKDSSFDKLLEDIPGTISTYFPTINSLADKDLKEHEDDASEYDAFATREAMIKSLKALQSLEAFNKLIGDSELKDAIDRYTEDFLTSSDNIDITTPESEFSKAFALTDILGWLDEYIYDGELQEGRIEEIVENTLTEAQDKCANLTFDYKIDYYKNLAIQQFNEAVKTNVINAGYSEKEFESLKITIDSLDKRDEAIKKLENLKLGTEGLNDPYYSLFDNENTESKRNLANKLVSAPAPQMPEAKNTEEVRRLREQHETEKKLEEQRIAEETARQQKIEDDFKPYADQAKFEDALNEGFEQYAKDNSDPEKESDRFRFDDKKRIETMSKLCGMWFPKDPDMQPIIDSLNNLSAMNVTAYEGYANETSLMTKIEQQINNCRASLEQQNEVLHQKSIEKLKVIPDNGGASKRWPTKEEIDANPKLKAVDEAFGEIQKLIDRKMSALESIAQFIEMRKNGELDKNELKENKNVRHIVVKTEDIERPGKNTDTAQKNNTVSIFSNKYADGSNLPLFPHQPSPDDARQGYIGDCYFISTLADVARHRPEKIREAMVDNNDGTVTVRLYGKRLNEETKESEYYPVYVTVDKKIPLTGFGNSQIAQNCVWINCFEKAVAASGLMSSFKYDKERGILRPVPEDTSELEKKYLEMKALQDQGKLSSQIIEETAKDFPWIFTSTDEGLSLVKWPSFNSIVGGTGVVATELIMGADIKRVKDDLTRMEDNVRVTAADKEKYINLNPRTIEQMCAVILANKNGALISNDFDVPCSFDLTLPPDKLFDEAFRLSGMSKASRQEALAEYNNNIKLMKDRLKDDLLTLNKNQLIDTAYTLFGRNDGGNLRRGTLLPLKEKPYNKAQIDVYNKIEDSIKKHLPVSASAKSEEGRDAKIPGNHQYSIIGVYTDEIGRRMVKMKNPWGQSNGNGVKTSFYKDGSRSYTKISSPNGEFEMELKDCMQELNHIEFSEAKELPVQPAPQKMAGSILNLNSSLSYTEALDKVCQDFRSTERWYGGDSESFKLLKGQVKIVRDKLPLIKTKEELISTLTGLSKKITDYEDHCKKKPVNDGRRNTKIRATNDLKNIIEAAKQEYISPKYYQKDLNIKQISNEIQTADKGIKDAFQNNKSELLVETIAKKLYFVKLSKEAPEMSANKLEAAMKQERCLEAVQKLKPLVARELAGMDRMMIRSFADDCKLDQKIQERMKEDFHSEKSIWDAGRQINANMKKITDIILDKNQPVQSAQFAK